MEALQRFSSNAVAVPHLELLSDLFLVRYKDAEEGAITGKRISFVITGNYRVFT